MMWSVRDDLPSGTVTFLFTDIEGSTKLLHTLGAEAYAEVVLAHRRALRRVFTRHGGVEVGTEGDSFFVAFPTATGALAAARDAQDELAQGTIRVRMGLHTGEAHPIEGDYFSPEVNKAARIAAAGHGGQVLVSSETRVLAPDRLTSLGEHRLKDFDTPIEIFQLGAGVFPPLKTPSNTNLPHPASSFVGREREVAELVSLIRGRTRLLTLTGPGGSGKTRLAIEAAAEVVPEFGAGVFWVSLSALRDPGLVTATIAGVLGAEADLVDHIGEREVLLLLDNFEQVIESAPEISALAEACPNLTLLVTSRELLRVRGEVEYHVDPLVDSEAISLFSERAGVRPDETVREICRALDNLPLALELAAARANVISPPQILQRLTGYLDSFHGGRDADPRQHTLRATIEWSHDLLSDGEKRLFRDLSIFDGGCTLEAAEGVAAADLDTLQSLIDKSLLRVRDGRFWMLETIRAFATELRENSDDEDLVRRHIDWFTAVADRADSALRGSPKEWLDRLEADHPNLRAALDRLEETGDTQGALKLAGALWRFWSMRGHFAEGGRRIENALASDDRPTAVRARALNGATAILLEMGDSRTARHRADEALELYRTLEDSWGVAISEFLIAQVVVSEGDYELGRQILETAVAQFRELGDEHYALLATRTLAWMYEELGDLDRSRALHEDSLRRARATGNRRIEARSLCALAMFAIDERRLDQAMPMLETAYGIDREIGEPKEIATELCRFAAALVVTGAVDAAARVLCAGQHFQDGLAVPFESWVRDMNDATLSSILRVLGEAAFTAACGAGQGLTPDEAVALALDSWHGRMTGSRAAVDRPPQ